MFSKRYCFYAVLFSSLVFLSACRPGLNESTDSEADRAPVSMTEVVDANNSFAMDMYGRLSAEPGNLFFSPYSISSAFAMVYEGARGSTAGEIREVFRFPEESGVLRQGFAELFLEINRPGRDYLLSTANALWAQKEYPFYKDYFSVVRNYYGANVSNLDFAGETEASRLLINSWVEENTNHRIKDLIPQGAIDPLTRMVLTNAVYFKGEWAVQFDPEMTRDADFTLSDSSVVKVPMMERTDDESKFAYMQDELLQMIEMPYSGEEISMLVLLPVGRDMASVEEALIAGKLDEWRSMLEKQRVDVYMPKFQVEKKYYMVQMLGEMGIRDAFAEDADFSGMADTKDLYISDVIHQAFVEVGEEGTEAAAATAIVIRLTAMPPEELRIPVFRADHPFIFIIQQKSSGNILFMGRVADPL